MGLAALRVVKDDEPLVFRGPCFEFLPGPVIGATVGDNDALTKARGELQKRCR